VIALVNRSPYFKNPKGTPRGLDLSMHAVVYSSSVQQPLTYHTAKKLSDIGLKSVKMGDSMPSLYLVFMSPKCHDAS
jgi:hypothetical protein